MRQIFLDTETTGLSPESGDRIVEIGCVEMINRRLSGNHRHYYINPERRNSEDALRIHGLTDEFLADKPMFAAIADELLEFVAGADIVIHNAGFDVGFLNEELRRLGRAPFTSHVARVTDSLSLAREMYPGKSNSLDALCKRLEVDNTSRTLHGALLDAGLLAEVYLRMTRGQNALVIDVAEVSGAVSIDNVAIDLRRFNVPVLAASAEELSAHETALVDLDRACGGQSLWRRLMAESPATP